MKNKEQSQPVEDEIQLVHHKTQPVEDEGQLDKEERHLHIEEIQQ